MQVQICKNVTCISGLQSKTYYALYYLFMKKSYLNKILCFAGANMTQEGSSLKQPGYWCLLGTSED